MNLRAFAESIPAEFWQWGSVNAIPRDPLRYIEVLEQVQGMTTPSNMHLLNLAVRQLAADECYLEVGTWRGATLIGALLGNDAYGVAIDDDSMNEHDGDVKASWDVCTRHLVDFAIADRVYQIHRSIPDAWRFIEGEAWQMPVGVYLFDGDKATDEAAWAGVEGALPFLASEALIILDDANDIHIRRAAWRLCHDYPQHAMKILDLPTPGNCWPMFWNGVIAIAWRG